jgi:hypothetical protein
MITTEWPMNNLAKAGLFAIFALVSCVVGVLIDIRQIRRQGEGSSFAIPMVFFSSTFICAGVGMLLFAEYLLTPQ